MPRVSVVIANLNRERDLLRCLNSVYKQEYPNLEVIVVDCRSTDNSVEIARMYYPETRVIVEAVDNGACASINLGCWSATGKYVLIMDNDAFLKRPGLLLQAIEVLESNPTVSIAGRNYAVEAIAGHISGPSNPPIPDDNKVHFNWMFCGAGVLIRRDFGNLVGWYDTGFFIYCNEMDLGAKMERQRGAIMHHPDFEFHHSYEASCRPLPRNTFYHSRNSYIVYWRYLPIVAALKYSILNFLRARNMPRNCVFPALKAALSALLKFHSIWQSRDPIQNRWMLEAFYTFMRGEPLPPGCEFHPGTPKH